MVGWASGVRTMVNRLNEMIDLSYTPYFLFCSFPKICLSAPPPLSLSLSLSLSFSHSLISLPLSLLFSLSLFPSRPLPLSVCLSVSISLTHPDSFSIANFNLNPHSDQKGRSLLSILILISLSDHYEVRSHASHSISDLSSPFLFLFNDKTRHTHILLIVLTYIFHPFSLTSSLISSLLLLITLSLLFLSPLV